MDKVVDRYISEEYYKISFRHPVASGSETIFTLYYKMRTDMEEGWHLGVDREYILFELKEFKSILRARKKELSEDVGVNLEKLENMSICLAEYQQAVRDQHFLEGAIEVLDNRRTPANRDNCKDIATKSIKIPICGELDVEFYIADHNEVYKVFVIGESGGGGFVNNYPNSKVYRSSMLEIKQFEDKFLRKKQKHRGFVVLG